MVVSDRKTPVLFKKTTQGSFPSQTTKSASKANAYWPMIEANEELRNMKANSVDILKRKIFTTK
jgi:hypothetical protein